jgi:hypothetical protein
MTILGVIAILFATCLTGRWRDYQLIFHLVEKSFSFNTKLAVKIDSEQQPQELIYV